MVAIHGGPEADLVYGGPGDKASVLKHINGKVVDWYKKKQAAITKVEPEYIKILDLKPEAPVEIRGDFKPIKTNVPGIGLTDLLRSRDFH